MPWQTHSPMSRRQEFIDARLDARSLSMRALCAQFGISEKTGYKWWARFRAGGPAALADASKAPKVPPHQLTPAVRDAILALREAHPTWGARKLRVVLQRTDPTTGWPAASTIQQVCKRAGLIPARRRHAPKEAAWATTALTDAAAPNDVWATDFKGEFRLQPGPYCYPLTVTDLHSRLLLACTALASTASAPVQQVFTALFQCYGLPRVIRSDNGVPFAQPHALGGLSRLAVWWIRLGIRPERTAKGVPQQNGAHERMHRTLKAEAMRPVAATLAAQQQQFDRWRHEFNTERPHESLGQTCPSAHYVASDRRWPRRLPLLEYPSHAELRCVDLSGSIKLHGVKCFLSTALAGEYVALEEVADARWQVRFGPLHLGHWVARDDTFEPDLRWLPMP